MVRKSFQYFFSIFFISCFLPVLLAVYWLIPGTKGKNWVLLVVGLVFYAFGGLTGIGLLLAAALGMEPADLHGGTDPQAGAGGGANGQKKLGEEERAFRSMVVALGLVVVFVLLLLFGYMVGRDMAAKDNRQACIAEGRTDCR